METSSKDNRTVLYVSHNMSTVRQLCNRCIVLDKGKVVFDGDTDKAIGVYVGTEDYMPSEIDYGPEYKPDEHILRSCESFSIKHLSLIGRDDPIFNNTEEAVLELKCMASRAYKDIGFRFEISYQDGSKIGTSFTNKFINVEPGECNVRLKLPMAHLQSGQYRADIVTFRFNGTPREEKLDAVYPGFVFQIEGVTDKENYLSWDHRYWGSVKLEDVDVE